MIPGRRLTFLVIPEEGGRTYEYKVPRLFLWLAAALALALVVLLGIGVSAWFEAGQLARRVAGLEREKAILTEQVELIDQLEVTLRDLEESNRQLRSITAEAVGLQTRAPNQRPSRLSPQVITIVDRLRFGNLRSVPTLIPVAASARRAYDRGLLLEAPRGSLVSASGAGQVMRTGYDPELGHTVVVDHRNGVETIYAGLGAVIVGDGDFVRKGQAVGLTGWPRDGSTPGLRFTVLEDGVDVTEATSSLWL